MKKMIDIIKSIRVGVFATCVLFSIYSCNRNSDCCTDQTYEDVLDFDKGFITSWQVDGKELIIPINEHQEYDYQYNYNIYWHKEQNPNINGKELNITNQKGSRVQLPEPGRYIVKITGIFPAIYFSPTSIAEMKGIHLTEIKQWGNIKWKSMQYAFAGCESLRISAKDAPDLSRVESMRGMFSGAKNFNDPLDKWDVSNVKDMSELFHNAKDFNQHLNSWKVSNVTNMEGMFQEARAFNKPLDKWYVGNVTNMSSMFYNARNFNQPIGGWKVSSVTNMNSMFLSSVSFNQELYNWDVSNVMDMNSMFYGARVFNQNLNYWELNEHVDLSLIFRNASAMEESNYKKWKHKDRLK